ncbi:MAG TPA: cupin domain-containing protein, partial [Nannocystaceae bacterium]|nr:cupin domain-containing protein [Nannocystaceae bacterium]
GLGAVDAARVDAGGVQHQRRITIAEIDGALAAGETVCADVSSSVHGLQALRDRWVPATEPAFAKLYASPTGAGFAMHMDAHHVFVLQLEGRKRWTYSPRPVVAAPLVGGKLVGDRAVHTFPRKGVPIVGDDGRPLAPPRSDDLVTVELVPGDCLYLPPGSWHTTRALAPSVAVSVSPPRAPALPFVLRMLEQQLARIPALRRDLVRSTNDTGPLSIETRRAIDAALAAIAELSGGVDRRLLHRAWALQAFAAERAAPAVEPVALRRTDVLAHAGPFEWLVAPIDGAELVCLYQRGAEWTLPIDARGFIEALARQRSFTAEDAMAWDRRLDWNGTRDFLAQLVAAGILTHARL